MRLQVRACVAAGALALLAVAVAGPLAAQGVTTAAVRGTILDEAGAPLSDVTLTLTNTSTGQRYAGVSRRDGRYNIENVAVGGPYVLEVRALGYQASRRQGFSLALGQSLELNIAMTRAVVVLEAITVTAEEQDPLIAASRTGTASYVSDSAIRRLPTLNRNFTDFVITSPQVVQASGLSFGGGHRKMNNIQIDGTSNNDLFGLGATGQPGGQVDAKSITLEAVKEYQVLIAPYDVRQSGFSGGLVNAVTRHGTNTWHGSLFWYYQENRLVRDTLRVTVTDPISGAADTSFSAFGQFRQHQRGFRLSGPIIRDKLMFFIAGEWQTRDFPNSGIAVGRESPTLTGISPDSAQRVADIFSTAYSTDPGTFNEVTLNTPNRNVFARLDWQINYNHQLALRWNHVRASDDALSRGSAGFYGYSSFNRTINNNTNSFVLQLNSTLGGGKYYNELRLGWQRIRDRRAPQNPFDRSGAITIRPQIEVRNRSFISPADPSVFNQFVIGGERFSHRNELDQDIFELDDALTWAAGPHTITLGTHNEWITFRNLFFHSADGYWRFNTLADLEAGTPAFYRTQIPYSDAAAGVPGSLVKDVPIADFGILQLGLYAQDQWELTRNISLTLGLRVDVPVTLESPDYNGLVDSTLSIRTDQLPSGNLHWSPRLGINWDVRGNRSTILRGGVGLFTGRIPYVWLSNAYTNTGREVLEVNCTGAEIPDFNESVFTTPPTGCRTTSGVSVPSAQVNVFDNGFRFPQYLKTSIGLDQRLPWNMLGTLEFLYTRGVNTILQKEANIAQTPIATNSEGRMMFGTLDPASGDATPQRITTSLPQVINHTNGSKDWSYQITAQLQKRFGQGFEFNGGYTYSKVRDLVSLTSSIASSNFGFSPVARGGNPNDRTLGVSTWEVPHKVSLAGTININIPNLPSSFTLIYVGQSGLPYTWTIDGDANADGYEAPNIGGRRNDIVYVPLADGSDFSPESPGDLTDYNALIESEECLRTARGSIPDKNTCRNPWVNRLDANLRVSLYALGGGAHNFTLVWDVFNVLNLLNGDWGQNKTIVGFSDDILRTVGYDTANDRPIYRYAGPTPTSKFTFSNTLSRWRMQFGLRYDF
jgi:hypothetical protein